MSTNKKAIKSIKSHIEAKDHEAAIYESTELLKKLDDSDPEAAQVWVQPWDLVKFSWTVYRLTFRGLALTIAGKKDEAEKVGLIPFSVTRSLSIQ